MEKKKSTINKDILISLILVLVIFVSLCYGMYGRTTTFRDWTIVFEGGYRIALGQIPYQDFYISTGPVVYLMQAFFNLFVGNNLLSGVIHSFVLSTILTLIFYYFLRKEFGAALSFIFAIFFHLSFLGLMFHSAYNHETYFFLFLNIFLILYYLKKNSLPIYVHIVSAIFGTLDFYTKQDTGILHLFLLCIYFFVNYKKDWKKIIAYYVIPAIIFVGGSYLFLSNLGEFTYWFNLGQSPHNSRIGLFFSLDKIVMIISSWYFYVSLFLIFFIIFKKSNKIKIMSLFVILSIINLVSNTLSTPSRQLFVTGIPLLVFFVYLLIKDHVKELRKNYKIAFGVIILLILILNINPFLTYGLVTLNYLNPNIERIEGGCFSGIYIPKQALDGLNRIRQIIKENSNFISITEYNFLYCDYNKTPPTKLPLFFSEGVSYFQENIEDITNAITSNNPQVIFMQDQHSSTKTLGDELIKKLVSRGYKITEVIDNTVAGDPITVLLREDRGFKIELGHKKV